MDGQNKHFWRRWKQEAEPLLNHLLTVLLIEAGVLLVGLGLRGLQYIFSERKGLFETLESLDIWTAVATWLMFTVYCVVTIFLRLIKSLKAEWRSGPPPRRIDGVLMDE